MDYYVQPWQLHPLPFESISSVRPFSIPFGVYLMFIFVVYAVRTQLKRAMREPSIGLQRHALNASE